MNLSKVLSRLLIGLVLCMPVLLSACPTEREDVLVVYNKNNNDSFLIAQHYAKRRCVKSDNVLGIYTKTVADVNWFDFLSINSQIIAGMFNLLESPLSLKKINPCSNKNIIDYWCEKNVTLLRKYSKIKHVVLIRGMPTRFVGSVIYRSKYNHKQKKYTLFNDKEVASIDDYLRYSLLNILPKTTDGKPYYFNDKSLQFSDIKRNGFIRAIDPKKDGRINVGRIDGLTVESAISLIDRTIDAEKNGIGGKVYWNNEVNKHFRSLQIFNPLLRYNPQYLGGSPIEKKTNNNKSRYLFGLLNESNPKCTGFAKGYTLYFNKYTIAPKECQAVLIFSPNVNKSLKPGFKNTALGETSNMLSWLGFLDGHSMYWSSSTKNKKSDDDGTAFNSILNIKKKGFEEKSCGYCDEAKDPSICKQLSSDALKELDTRCVGVAEGFFGFNFQSYPVAYFSAWPTSWSTQAAHTWGGSMGGGFSYYGLPYITEDANYLNYTYKKYDSDRCFDFSKGGKEVSCELGSQFIISIGQRKNIQALKFSKNNNTHNKEFILTLKYKYKAPVLNPDAVVKINIRLALREKNTSSIYTDAPVIRNYNCDAPILLKGYELTDTQGKWKTASFKHNHSIDTACNRVKGKHNVDSVVYDGLRLEIKSRPMTGSLAIDDVSVVSEGLKNSDGSKFTLYNASFDKGFKQSATGDHASVFISRLNGVAFWGSVSHHNSGGRSFVDEQKRENRGNSLALFLQGLTLGEAAAINETGKGSGVFYGDPLYSPIAVKLNPLSLDDAPYPSTFKNGFIKENISIYGSVKNGEKSTGTLFYCKTKTTDFAACKHWQKISKITSVKNNDLLGIFSTKHLSLGNHLIKLTVTTTLPNGHVAEFNDFMVIKKLDPLAFQGLSNW